MTVSTSVLIDFQRDQILQMAFQLAGLVGGGKVPSADDTGMAANFMRLELMALQAEKVILQTTERTTLALVAGTAEYALPTDTVDIQPGPNDQVGTILRSGGTETLVTLMSRAEYMDVSDKTAAVAGTPTRVYVEKQAVVTAVFWPVPDASSLSFRYARVRFLKDTDAGSVTLDLARKWHKYLTFAVAAQVARAKSLPLDNVMSLTKEAERLKEICKADDNQRGNIRFRLAHRGRTF
jgi:hypothetical protein